MAAQKVLIRKRKPGGGRKPKAATVLKRAIIANRVEEAEQSFAFLVEVRDSDDWPKQLRLQAAIYIIDRTEGKPKERHELTGNNGGPLEVKAIDYSSSITPLAPGSVGDSEPSS